jgi:hypothetical protein
MDMSFWLNRKRIRAGGERCAWLKYGLAGHYFSHGFGKVLEKLLPLSPEGKKLIGINKSLLPAGGPVEAVLFLSLGTVSSVPYCKDVLISPVLLDFKVTTR